MRRSVFVILVSTIFSSASLAQTESEVPVAKSPPPSMTAAQPLNPVASKPGAPIIQSLSAQLPDTGPLLVTRLLSTQFHFVAPNGNAVLLHREVAKTSANNVNLSPNQAINIPPDAQKQGAIVTGGWNCNVNAYYVTFRAYIMDADGNRSNEVQYTVHCNGG
jgi:hypothetical protein